MKTRQEHNISSNFYTITMLQLPLCVTSFYQLPVSNGIVVLQLNYRSLFKVQHGKRDLGACRALLNAT